MKATIANDHDEGDDRDEDAEHHNAKHHDGHPAGSGTGS